MKVKAFWHVCTINHYFEILQEQIGLIKSSGLYDILHEIHIGISGEKTEEIIEFVSKHDKLRISSVAAFEAFEFQTLRLIYLQSQKEKEFWGVYFHTKGVSWPGHEGGKYWRDYMNFYNLTKWKDCLKKLRKGYNLCGVKFLRFNESPASCPHYSGNFFWFKSNYIKTCPDPFTLNMEDRFSAEMWSCMGANPVPASLCQDFVDYNTKGVFKGENQKTGKNYVHTLSWNFPSETAIATKLLKEQCEEYEHYIIDLGFPLESYYIPKNLANSIKNNSAKLKDIAKIYGSKVVRMDNIGVSQNWTNVYRMLNMDNEDILAGADPDERPLNKGWVEAMGNVMRNGKYRIGMCSLLMQGHEQYLRPEHYREEYLSGIRVWFPKVDLNWALIGFSGEFLNTIKEIPYPKDCPKYGYIESMTKPLFIKHGFDYVILPDYRVQHTDYELGESGTSRLLREWKNTIIFKRNIYGQISLDEFLKLKQKGEL